MNALITGRKALILDADGLTLTPQEEQLFKSEKPAGFILFKRNCVSVQQVADLVAAMRACVGDVPVLIDQEGGSVARLREPAFREYPSARHFADLVKTEGLPAAVRAARENSRRMGEELAAMGITVNCAPVADVPSPDCHKFLSESRTYGDDADVIAALGEGVCRGLLDAGVSPVIKHIPGHGRAKVDSHFALPVTDASFTDLSATDFKPFKYLSQTDMKTALWAMAAHVVYSALDPDSAATLSRKITDEVVRGYIGFAGVLIADDVSMKALGGTVGERVAKTMAAGMDLTMICNAPFEDRVAALAAAPPVSAASAVRIAAAEEGRKRERKDERNAVA
jgi:beta-N-acetylhexosaminidase